MILKIKAKYRIVHKSNIYLFANKKLKPICIQCGIYLEDGSESLGIFGEPTLNTRRMQPCI
jgi:hypothetical protein